MTKPTHLSWNNFYASIYVPGEQRVHRVSVSPIVDIFGDGIERRIGIWIEVASDTVLPADACRLAFIKTAIATKGGKTFLEVMSTAEDLHRHFYLFATSVADGVLVDGLPPPEAIVQELICFSELLQVKPLLSFERQIGLLGELLFLERLIDQLGTSASDAWAGPIGDPHDFRLNQCEFEVKTTTATRRIHTINGEGQLLPSQGRSLYLLSILLGPAGQAGGVSLAAEVVRIQAALGGNAAVAARFRQSLQKCGYSDADREHYRRTFVLRRPMQLVPIDDAFPALTRSRIIAGVGAAAERIEHVQYDLDIEGLGWADGTPTFASVLNRNV